MDMVDFWVVYARYPLLAIISISGTSAYNHQVADPNIHNTTIAISIHEIRKLEHLPIYQKSRF